MGALHGKTAAIKKNSVAVALAQEWNINVSLIGEDITDFGDAWKAIQGGLAEWAGTMVFYFDPSNTEQKAIHDAVITATPTGALTDVTFYVSAANYYSGNIVVTGVAIAVTVAGIIKMTVSFQGNGAVSYN